MLSSISGNCVSKPGNTVTISYSGLNEINSKSIKIKALSKGMISRLPARFSAATEKDRQHIYGRNIQVQVEYYALACVFSKCTAQQLQRNNEFRNTDFSENSACVSIKDSILHSFPSWLLSPSYATLHRITTKSYEKAHG